ncbi:MAG: hypothetical protein M1831_004608 [Alyxoria varia]|nr:MAG: hypothetical protein M1831_004608 [Alyxoria varia]
MAPTARAIEGGKRAQAVVLDDLEAGPMGPTEDNVSELGEERRGYAKILRRAVTRLEDEKHQRDKELDEHEDFMHYLDRKYKSARREIQDKDEELDLLSKRAGCDGGLLAENETLKAQLAEAKEEVRVLRARLGERRESSALRDDDDDEPLAGHEGPIRASSGLQGQQSRSDYPEQTFTNILRGRKPICPHHAIGKCGKTGRNKCKSSHDAFDYALAYLVASMQSISGNDDWRRPSMPLKKLCFDHWWSASGCRLNDDGRCPKQCSHEPTALKAYARHYYLTHDTMYSLAKMVDFVRKAPPQ